MTATVQECCRGKVTNHMGKGRCAADQGGIPVETKIEFAGAAVEIDAGGDEPVLGWEINPAMFGLNCVTMIECLMSTDPCGDPIDPPKFAVHHVLPEPCDPTRVILQLFDGGEPVTEVEEPYCVWLRVYGT